jgi:endonuclease III
MRRGTPASTIPQLRLYGNGPGGYTARDHAMAVEGCSDTGQTDALVYSLGGSHKRPVYTVAASTIAGTAYEAGFCRWQCSPTMVQRLLSHQHTKALAPPIVEALAPPTVDGTPPFASVPRCAPADWKRHWSVLQSIRKVAASLGVESDVDKMVAYLRECAESHFFVLLVLLLSTGQVSEARVLDVAEAIKHNRWTEHHTWTDISEQQKTTLTPLGHLNTRVPNITNMAVAIRDQHSGLVPNTLAKLMKLKGVGHKTSVVFLHICHAQQAGLPIERHSLQVCRLLGWCDSSRPEQCAMALKHWLPAERWFDIWPLMASVVQHIRAADTFERIHPLLDEQAQQMVVRIRLVNQPEAGSKRRLTPAVAAEEDPQGTLLDGNGYEVGGFVASDGSDAESVTPAAFPNGVDREMSSGIDSESEGSHAGRYTDDGSQTDEGADG